MIRRLITAHRARRARRAADIARIEQALLDLADPVDAAFEDYQTSIADLLDEHPGRSRALIEGLEAATAAWEQAQFASITGPLRRDLRFRLALARAWRTRPVHKT